MSTQKHGPHRHRYENEGVGRYLTWSCFRRRPFFAVPDSSNWFVEALAASREQHQFQLWAWVIMPEHVHLLIGLSPGQLLPPIQQSIKQRVTRRCITRARSGGSGLLEQMLDRQPNGEQSLRFWLRGGGYDRNVRTVAELHEKIDYMHKNPVRRGLVKHPGEWQWSSWRAWNHHDERPIISVDRHSLPMLNS